MAGLTSCREGHRGGRRVRVSDDRRGWATDRSRQFNEGERHGSGCRRRAQRVERPLGAPRGPVAVDGGGAERSAPGQRLVEVLPDLRVALLLRTAAFGGSAGEPARLEGL